MARNFRSRSPSVVGGRGPRRQTQWGATTTSATVAIAAATKVLFARFTFAQLAASVGTPVTHIRERGLLTIFSDQVAADENQLGAIGFAVVSEVAGAAGAASIPGPFTEADWDGWYAWAPIVARFEFLTVSGIEPHMGIEVPIDSKAMRKVNDEDSLVIMIENGSSTDGFNAAYIGRSLFKLH